MRRASSLAARLSRRLLWMSWCWMLPLAATGQHTVPPCTGWVATVDEPSQQIVLRWRASTDPLVAGYHICTGDTCRQYAVLNHRTDTSLVCTDHSPLLRHTYRLHVFDSNANPSALTPPFGNMVLQAAVPTCATAVSAQWSPYTGMPSGVAYYTLYARIEPFQTDFAALYTTDTLGPLAYAFDMPDGATRLHLKVCAVSRDRRWQSVSNIVSVERNTTDTASLLAIDTALVDSLHSRVTLRLLTDTAFSRASYTLWRSVGGSPWRAIASFPATTTTFLDTDIHPYADTLYCYQLSVPDACGLNPRYSATRCVRVPTPPDPEARMASAIIVGDELNGRFLPYTVALAGDLYDLAIYNRMGLEVFRSTSPTEAWEPSTATPQGAYTYVLRVRFMNNKVQTYIGTITVIH